MMALLFPPFHLTLYPLTGNGFTHRIIGAYAPWNPGVDDGDFWLQVAKICCESQHLWTLAGYLNVVMMQVDYTVGSSMTPTVLTCGKLSQIRIETGIGHIGHVVQQWGGTSLIA